MFGICSYVDGSGGNSFGGPLKSHAKSPKLSRKPRRSVVSEGEKRSAEDGSGGGLGKRLDKEGSNVNSKSEKGGGGRGEWDIVGQVEEGRGGGLNG